MNFPFSGGLSVKLDEVEIALAEKHNPLIYLTFMCPATDVHCPLSTGVCDVNFDPVFLYSILTSVGHCPFYPFLR